MANRITLQKGTNGPAVLFAIQRRSAAGGYEKAVGTWLDTDPLECVVWPGGDRAIVTRLPVEWHSADDGIVQVTYPAGSWTGVDPGVYSAAVRLATSPPTNLVLFEIELEVGTANGVARPTYLERADLEEEYPGLEKLVGKVDVDQTGFANLRADARNWLDLLILSHYQPSCSSSPYQFDIPWLNIQPETNVWLADALENNGLLQWTPNGRRLRKGQTYWVLSRIFRRLAVANATQAAHHLDVADYYERKANDMVTTSIAEIDLVGDGRVSLTISLRSTVTRRR